MMSSEGVLSFVITDRRLTHKGPCILTINDVPETDLHARIPGSALATVKHL